MIRSTRWRTVQYLRNPKLGGIKRGVGLVFDLGAAQPVHEVRLALSGNGHRRRAAGAGQGPRRHHQAPDDQRPGLA